MSIPTQVSLNGFIAAVPELHHTKAGAPRFYARIGCEQFRREVDGSLTKLDPTFHDLVSFDQAALKAYERLRKGDSFVASGYIHEYEINRDGTTHVREEFVARRLGHDMARTAYDVHRRLRPSEPNPTQLAVQAPAVGM